MRTPTTDLKFTLNDGQVFVYAFKDEQASTIMNNVKINENSFCCGISCYSCAIEGTCSHLTAHTIKSIEVDPAQIKPEQPEIYKMKLHEEMSIGRVIIVRVPGGWTYSADNCAVFVPYNEEFMPKDHQ